MQELKDYLLSPFWEALTSTVVRLVLAVTVSVIAGIIPTLIANICEGYLGLNEPLFLAICWMLHWGISGAGIWGIPFFPLQIWFVQQLVREDIEPRRALMRIFGTQLIVSSGVVAQFSYGWLPRICVIGVAVVLWGMGVWMDRRLRAVHLPRMGAEHAVPPTKKPAR